MLCSAVICTPLRAVLSGELESASFVLSLYMSVARFLLVVLSSVVSKMRRKCIDSQWSIVCVVMDRLSLTHLFNTRLCTDMHRLL